MDLLSKTSPRCFRYTFALFSLTLPFMSTSTPSKMFFLFLPALKGTRSGVSAACPHWLRSSCDRPKSSTVLVDAQPTFSRTARRELLHTTVFEQHVRTQLPIGSTCPSRRYSFSRTWPLRVCKLLPEPTHTLTRRTPVINIRKLNGSMAQKTMLCQNLFPQHHSVFRSHARSCTQHDLDLLCLNGSWVTRCGASSRSTTPTQNESSCKL